MSVRSSSNENQSFLLEVARGNIKGMKSVNKFGAAPNGAQTTATDIWSRANATPTQQIWVAPTQARQHAIASSSDLDGKTAAPNSVGARTIRIYGLTSWSTAETSEDITLDGTTGVLTANNYVIIHRMKVLTSGSQSINVGTISATAATDNTITAVIIAGEGQTEMAIYGVPSTQDAYCFGWYAAIDKTSAAATTCDFELRVNENPNAQLLNFIRKDDISLQSTGTNMFQKQFMIPNKFSGACIIKIQAIASSVDTDAEAGFDLILVDK